MLAASASTVAGSAKRLATAATTTAATPPLPVLASFAKRIAASRSALELARTMAWASTQGTDTPDTVVTQSRSP